MVDRRTNSKVLHDKKLDVLQQIVKKEYKKLYRQIHQSALETFQNISRNLSEQPRQAPRIIPNPKFSQEINKNDARIVLVNISDGRNKNPENRLTKATLLPAISSIRELISYVPTKKNLATRGNLIGIPYLGDTFNDEDQQLINSISEENKEQEKTRIRNRKLDDQSLEILYRSIRSNETSNHYSNDQIIEAILYYHCDFSPRVLLRKFASSSSSASPSHDTNIDTSDNIDMTIDDLIIKRWCSRFCPRCYTYNCLLHREKYPHLPLAKQFFLSSNSQSSPCSSICYKHHHPQSLKRPLSYVYPSDDDNDDEENIFSNKRQPLSIEIPSKQSLTLTDRSLFRLVYFLFDGDLCLIKQIFFSSNTCDDLYQEFLFNRQYFTSQISFDSSSKFVIRQIYRRQMLEGLTRAFLLHIQKYQTSKIKPIYQPCSHDGPCLPTNKNCTCMKNGTYCEKFCNCSVDCPHRFPGCNCKGACLLNNCLCCSESRECDPDLCQKCGASIFVNDNPIKRTCANISLQRHVYKQIFIAESDVAGYGAFLGSDVAYPGDLIGEYTGEIISESEADRRGRLYDKQACSYLFNLDRKRCVDARQFGNKIRFLNHSSKPNCVPKIKFVNGDYRIGIYAKQMIFQDEELFFEYRYDPHQRQQFVNNERIDQYERNGLKILKRLNDNFLLVQTTSN